MPITKGPTLRINRAPVLTLWGAVVAERLGMPRETALTCGQTLAGLNAYSKGVRLGMYEPPEERPHEPPPPLPKGVKKVRNVELLGRLIHVAETPDGPRAIAKGELVKAEAVDRYLRSKFGDALEAVRTEMERLASRFSPAQLNREWFHLYEQFRPQIPAGERGWGAKGILNVARIRARVTALHPAASRRYPDLRNQRDGEQSSRIAGTGRRCASEAMRLDSMFLGPGAQDVEWSSRTRDEVPGAERWGTLETPTPVQVTKHNLFARRNSSWLNSRFGLR
jgi:hypothetical protein